MQRTAFVILAIAGTALLGCTPVVDPQRRQPAELDGAPDVASLVTRADAEPRSEDAAGPDTRAPVEDATAIAPDARAEIADAKDAAGDLQDGATRTDARDDALGPAATGLKTLPGGWSFTDIGKMKVPTAVSTNGTTYEFTFTSVENPPWKRVEDPDGCFHAYKPIGATATLTVRLTSGVVGGFGGPGIAMRASLDPLAMRAALLVQRKDAGVTVHSYVRNRASGIVNYPGSGDVTLGFPLWLRLQRAGKTYTGSFSRDGSVWTTMWSKELPVEGAGVTAGMSGCASTSGANGRYDNVTLIQP